jgi:predicted  nucleic acid-binding Zn-ribbon protein
VKYTFQLFFLKLIKLREKIQEEQTTIDKVKQEHARKKRKLIEAEQEFRKEFG